MRRGAKTTLPDARDDRQIKRNPKAEALAPKIQAQCRSIAAATEIFLKACY